MGTLVNVYYPGIELVKMAQIRQAQEIVFRKHRKFSYNKWLCRPIFKILLT